MAMELANATSMSFDKLDDLLVVMPCELRRDFTSEYGKRVMSTNEAYGMHILQKAKELGARIDEGDLEKLVKYRLNSMDESYPQHGLHVLKDARKLGADVDVTDSRIVQAAEKGYKLLEDDFYLHKKNGLEILADARDIGVRIDENKVRIAVKSLQEYALSYQIMDKSYLLSDLKRMWGNLLDYEGLKKSASEHLESMRRDLNIERGLIILSNIKDTGIEVDPRAVKSSIESAKIDIYSALQGRENENILWYLGRLGVKLDPTKLTHLVENGYRRVGEYVGHEDGLMFLKRLHAVGAELDRSKVAAIGYKWLKDSGEFLGPDVRALEFAKEIGAELDANRIANWGYEWVENTLRSGFFGEGLHALKLAKDLGMKIDIDRIKAVTSYDNLIHTIDILKVIKLCGELGIPTNTEVLIRLVKESKEHHL